MIFRRGTQVGTHPQRARTALTEFSEACRGGFSPRVSTWFQPQARVGCRRSCRCPAKVELRPPVHTLGHFHRFSRSHYASRRTWGSPWFCGIGDLARYEVRTAVRAPPRARTRFSRSHLASRTVSARIPVMSIIRLCPSRVASIDVAMMGRMMGRVTSRCEKSRKTAIFQG